MTKGRTRATRRQAAGAATGDAATTRPAANGSAPESLDLATLTLGPCLFNWSPEQWRDFYFRVADEAPIDRVHVGEVVCTKRAPFLDPHIPAVIERLRAAGKAVVLASPAQVMTARRDREAARALVEADEHVLVEANDVAVLSACLEARRPFAVGPFVNVYNEATAAWLAARGAVRFCLPVELGPDAVSPIAGAVARMGGTSEVFAFGRVPLALSARCYHARAHGLSKDSCRYVCAEDPDGMPVDTLDGNPFLAVNGIQTLSHGCRSLLADLESWHAAGVRSFRLSPHGVDMVAVAQLFRDVLDGRLAPDEASERLARRVEAEAGLVCVGGIEPNATASRGLARLRDSE